MVQPILFVNKVAQNESQSQPKQSLFSDGEDDTLADFFDPNEAAAARNDGESTDTAAAGNPASAVATQTLVVANNADAQIIGGSTKVKTELGSSNIADSSSGTQMISPPNGGSTEDAPESVDLECVPESTVKAMQTYPWLHSTLENIKKNRGVILTSVGVLAMAILAAQSMPELAPQLAQIAGMTDASMSEALASKMMTLIQADSNMSSALVPYSDAISTGTTLGAFMRGLSSLIGVSATSAWAWLGYNGACAHPSSLVTPSGSASPLHGTVPISSPGVARTDKQVVSRILPDPKGRPDRLVVAVSSNAAVKDIQRIAMSLIKPPFTHAVLMMKGAAYLVIDAKRSRKLSKYEMDSLKSSLGAKKNLVLSPDGKIAFGNTGERILVAQLVTDEPEPEPIKLLDDVVANTMAEFSAAKIHDTTRMTTSNELRDLCQSFETDTVFVTKTQILYFAKGSHNLVVSARDSPRLASLLVSARDKVPTVNVVVLTTRGKDGLIHMLNSEQFFATTTNADISVQSMTKAQLDNTSGGDALRGINQPKIIRARPGSISENDIIKQVRIEIKEPYGGTLLIVDGSLFFISPSGDENLITVKETDPVWEAAHTGKKVVVREDGTFGVPRDNEPATSRPVALMKLLSEENK